MRSWNSSTSRWRVLALERPPHVRLAQQHLDRSVDLFVVVDGAVGVQLVAVLVEHRAEARDVVAPGLHDVGVDEPEPDLAQGLEVRRVHVGVRAGLDGTSASMRRRISHSSTSVLRDPAPSQHFVSERVQRAHPAPRTFGHVGEPFAHRFLGPDVVGDGGDRARVLHPRPTSRRSRSVSTRVLPDPAGAITRAAPVSCTTAAS